MQDTKTLTLKRPTKTASYTERPEKYLIGRKVHIQTKSASRFEGKVLAFANGWVTLEGSERRWLPDGSLSVPIPTGLETPSRLFIIDRQNIAFFSEVM